MTFNKRYIVWIILAAVVVWMGREGRHNSDSANHHHPVLQSCVFAGAAVYGRIAIKRGQRRDEAAATNPCPGCGTSLKGNATGTSTTCGRVFEWTCPKRPSIVAPDGSHCDTWKWV